MRVIFFLLIVNVLTTFGKTVEMISLSLPRDMINADLYYISLKESESVNAVLVLCPGVNANGNYLAESSIWQNFAEVNKLGLVAISFASLPAQITA